MTGGLAGQVTQGGDGQHDHRPGRDVTPGHGRADPGALLRQPGGQVLSPGHRQVARRGQADQQRGGHRAHGRDIGQILRGRLTAYFGGRRPVAPEMPAFDQKIRAGNHPAVRGADYGPVIADAHEQGLCAWQPGRQRRDEAEFPQVCDGNGALPTAGFALR